VRFRALARIDKALIDLTIKVTLSVHSSSLAGRILAVTSKLKGLLEGRIARATS